MHRLLINESFLAQKIELDNVLPLLYKDKVISRQEHDSLHTALRHQGVNAATEKLVQLLTTKDVTAYEKFVASLKSTGQAELAGKLETKDVISPESKLSARDVETLRTNTVDLVRNMKIKQIVKHLEHNETFWTTAQRNKMKSYPTPQKQTEALMDHIATGTHLQLTQLIQALQHVGQYDLIRKLPAGLNVRNNASSEKHPEANLIPQQPFKLNVKFCPRSTSSASKIRNDVKNNQLAIAIHQQSHLNGTIRPYELKIEIVEHESTGTVKKTGFEAPATATSSSALSGRDHAGSREVMRKAVHEMIAKKEYTPYDLWVFLRRHNGRGYKSPFDLSDDHGMPLTHMCVDKGRLPLLQVIFHMGWWTLLSRKKVPATSQSPYKGMTCLEVAEAKRARKPVDEVKMYTEWENSLSSIMKSARSGDYARVVTLIENEGESIHYRDMNNGNVLYWAIVSGNLAIFQALLNKGGVDPTMRTRKNETLLHIACLLGMTEFISELLNYNIDVYFHDNSKKTALDRVAENGDNESLKAFVSCDIELKTSFPVLAAFSGRRALLEYCLDKKYHSIDSEPQL